LSDVDSGDFENVGMKVGLRGNGSDRKGGESKREQSCEGVELALTSCNRGEEQGGNAGND
jgi:hypothetical protein